MCTTQEKLQKFDILFFDVKDAMSHSINIQWLSTVKSNFYILYSSSKIFLANLKLGYEVFIWL